MSAYTYSIKTPGDLVKKAERELERMKAVSSELTSEIDVQADHAFNCAVSIWHVVDWLAKSTDAKVVGALRTLNLQSFNALHAHVRNQCDELHICYQIATGSKHFEMAGTKLPMRSPTVADTATSAIATTTLADVPPYFLKVVLADGRRLRAIDVFEKALAYWKQFFISSGL